MRLIFTILFLWAYTASATNYHIKNGGNDALDGLTDATAWANLSKIRAGSFVAGDNILLKRGSTWNDSIEVMQSGAINNPIIIGAYGTGAPPVVTGLTDQVLTSSGGNIYSGVSNGICKELNTVIVNGKIQRKARYPNSGYLTATALTTRYQMTTGLSGTPNYTGTECVVRSSHYTIDVCKVSSQSGGTINFRDPTTYAPFTFGANGYFFQNDSTFLDQEGEWYHDSATNIIKVYSASAPSVQISSIDILVKVSHQNYITFENITFKGANKVAFEIDSTVGVTVTNCTKDLMGGRGVNAKKARRLIIQNDTTRNTMAGGYMLWDNASLNNNCDTCRIEDVYLKNIAIYQGMNPSVRYGNGNGESIGMYIVGDSNTINYFTADSVGYNGLNFAGPKTKIYRPFISNYCATKDDGAAIYTTVTTGFWPLAFDFGSKIIEAIAINGIGDDAGTSVPSFASGIYFDGNSARGMEVYNSLLFNGHNAAYYANQSDSINFHDNLIINNEGNVVQWSGFTSTPGNIFKNNVLYTNGSDAYDRALINFLSVTNPGTLDSNFYLKPAEQTYPFTTSSNPITYAQFLSLFGGNHDLNSSLVPTAYNYFVPNSQTVVYNPTKTDSTIALSGKYVDVKTRTYYSDQIILTPFKSVLLFKVYQNVTGTSRNIKYKLF